MIFLIAVVVILVLALGATLVKLRATRVELAEARRKPVVVIARQETPADEGRRLLLSAFDD